MKDELVAIPVTESVKVSGILSIPDAGPSDTGVILAHGAGNDMNHPMLTSLLLAPIPYSSWRQERLRAAPLVY
ncbi:MAG: hypothetical protein ABSG91_10910 [Syntrophobacteraceae bacterium]|jgi:hypothetical protein